MNCVECLKNCIDICLEGLRINAKDQGQGSRCPDQNLNPDSAPRGEWWHKIFFSSMEQPFYGS